jgi:hypothetical protein
VRVIDGIFTDMLGKVITPDEARELWERNGGEPCLYDRRHLVTSLLRLIATWRVQSHITLRAPFHSEPFNSKGRRQMVPTFAAFACCIVATVTRRVRHRGTWLLVPGLPAAVAVAVGFLTLAGDRGRPSDVESRVLYVVEMVRSGKTADEADRLIRVRLGRDRKLVTETVLTAKTGFFGDPSKARIADGRYVITQFGGVVDAREGRIIHNQMARYGYLLGVENDRVVYRLYDPYSPIDRKGRAPQRAEEFGTFEFNLKTRIRARPEAKQWYLEGIKSPDRSKAVVQSCWDELYLYLVDGTQRKLAEGRQVTVSKYRSLGQFEIRRPVLWLDNERLLTQQANGRLVTLDAQGKVERICEIPGVPAVLDAPRLWRDPKGRIVYSCGRAEYVIDMERKTASALEEYALGHGFETTVETGERGVRALFFEGKSIGMGVFSPEMVRTAPDVIAMRDLDDLRSRRSVSVLWTKLGFQWRSFDMDYGGVIGWAE